MIRHKKLWCMVPSEPIVGLLPSLRWLKTGTLRASSSAAALMLYVALNFVAEKEVDDEGNARGRAEASYAELTEITGLSRALISEGLTRLVDLKLITPTGSDQKRGYLITWGSPRFFKLPCRAILRTGKIAPFHDLSLRSKRELYALKLYLYLASIRENHRSYSMASHQKISVRVGIPEGEIRRAHSLLTSVGLLAGVAQDYNEDENRNEPNRYYLTGSNALFKDVTAVIFGQNPPPLPPAAAVKSA